MAFCGSDLFVCSESTDSVRRYDGATGAYKGDFVTLGSGGLGGPQGITLSPDGTFYVVGDYQNSVLYRIDAVTGANLGVLTNSGGLLQPNNTVFGPPAQTETLVPNSEQILLGTQNSGGNFARWDSNDGNLRRVSMP